MKTKHKNVEYYNYGGTGLGNIAIQTLILEADIKFKFNSDDIILINWSGWNRNDFYRTTVNHTGKYDGWTSGSGSVLHLHPPYKSHFLERYWTLENDYIKNSTAMIYTHKSYGKNIKINGSITDVFGFERKQVDASSDKIKEIIDYYGPHISECIVWDKMYYKCGYIKDSHPDILEHMNFLLKAGVTLNDITKSYFINIHNDLMNKEFKDRRHLREWTLNKYTEWDKGDITERI